MTPGADEVSSRGKDLMIKGVNLGNWLVLEKWMNPDLFAGTEAEDETQLCSDLEDVAKRERFKVHRDSYVTERDFAYLANHRIDAVRIPVPFFVFGDYPPRDPTTREGLSPSRPAS
jgi:glucan 1,3-beta-glucosidase